MVNKSFIRKLVIKFFPNQYVKYSYKRHFGVYPNLENPRNFNEKILWIILNWKHPLLVECTDKYRMREYVRKCSLEFLLPQLYGFWNNASLIEWDKLPEQYVLKCNHGCGMNIICDGNGNLDIDDSIRKLNKWLHVKYGGDRFYEPHYLHINPLVFAEEYIQTSDGRMPIDYKIYCFNGKPELVLACVERDINVHLEFYDLTWNVLDIGAEKNRKKARRPASLNKMIEYAKKLSEPFPFVRVDFYDRDGEPILGELTFTPFYGMARYYSDEGNDWLGSLLSLPEKYEGCFN